MENLAVQAISDAIDMSEKLDGATVVDTAAPAQIEETLDYNQLRNEAYALWQQLVGEGDNANEEMARRILKRVEMIFGKPMKLSEITEPYLVILNSLPKSALAPLLIVWLGATQTTIIVAGMSVAIFGSILNLYTSFNNTDMPLLKITQIEKINQAVKFD